MRGNGSNAGTVKIGFRQITVMVLLMSCSVKENRFVEAIAHAREACAKGPLIVFDDERWEVYQKSLAEHRNETAEQVQARLGIKIIAVRSTERTGDLSSFEDPSWQLTQHGKPIAALYWYAVRDRHNGEIYDGPDPVLFFCGNEKEGEYVRLLGRDFS